MYSIKRVLVALDTSEMDDALIKHLIRLSNIIDLEKAYFVHVEKHLELPESISLDPSEFGLPVDETIQQKIESSIVRNGKEKLKVPYKIEVIEGSRSSQILHWAAIKKADLICVGRKSGLKGEGTLSHKIARLAPCSVVYVPEILPEHFKNFVVPVNFTETSKMALEYAVELCSNSNEGDITCLNVFEVPAGYHYSGKSFEEFADIMLENARKKYKQWIANVDLKGIEVHEEYVLDKHDDTAQAIYNFTVKQQTSNIVIGSKGRTMAAALILGSVAEKLVLLNKHIPLFVAKEKNHNMDFFDALMEL